MPPPPPFFNPVVLISELAFTMLAVIFCFLIYFKTKESYELTKYEGIKYFRGAFLFFGLSYILRFIFSLMHFSQAGFEFIFPREMFALLFILPLGYFSTIGIFYLIFGSAWKSVGNNKIIIIIGHVVAVLLSIVAFITRSQRMLLFLQCALLVIAVILNFVMHKKGKKLSQIKVLYFLIAILWLINLLIIDNQRPLPLEAEFFFQVLSVAVFIIIYHKISKWVK